MVVPTWNEAEWLPRLLIRATRSLSSDDIVIADNRSSDQTRAIAREFGCQVVDGGRPAEARNNGASFASHDVVIFADADVVFGPAVIERVQEMSMDQSIAAIHFPLVPATSNCMIRLAYSAMNLYFWALNKVGLAQGVGSFMAVRRWAFIASGGFRADLDAGEDADLFRRINRFGSVVFDRSVFVGVSARRFYFENPMIFGAKTMLWAVLRLADLPISVIPYRWEPYPKNLAQLDNVRLSHLERAYDSREPDGSQTGRARRRRSHAR
jgi:glycosyltransferase involved in cell wall biosynthesis